MEPAMQIFDVRVVRRLPQMAAETIIIEGDNAETAKKAAEEMCGPGSIVTFTHTHVELEEETVKYTPDQHG
jgi:hypothetical protein